ncbi:MAG TPA: hypothetical protein VKP12_12190 [Kiloniellaceae bacterium]|nr:hypothetical protein [Kiloniellaceae bacterium]
MMAGANDALDRRADEHIAENVLAVRAHGDEVGAVLVCRLESFLKRIACRSSSGSLARVSRSPAARACSSARSDRAEKSEAASRRLIAMRHPERFIAPR